MLVSLSSEGWLGTTTTDDVPVPVNPSFLICARRRRTARAAKMATNVVTTTPAAMPAPTIVQTESRVSLCGADGGPGDDPDDDVSMMTVMVVRMVWL